ncbi:hypothetical protein BGZ99_000956 [Dissophora globulifera]|uniref:NACHT domain-containing protein n=1 Tax=Dissophora globulifera TaxID=979702 RepID=A0A9P6RTZ0_9FUNG|nr:hypothetical protein BGZ99_000956 [Dissophora globulifera]
MISGNTTTSIPGQPALSSIQVPVSISATRVTLSQSFFNTDVSPVSYIEHFPGPDEPLQTTHQLACCLSLLKDSVQENELTAETIEWRRRILSNLSERNRLMTLSVQIVKTFADDPLKDATTVDEVVQLAPVLDKEHSRSLITILIDTLNQSEMLHLHSLEGLAKAIQEAAPGSIDSNDLVAILRSLHKKLRLVHSESVEHRSRLLYSVSRVLDAVADARVENVERVDLHEPLTELLRASESSKDPYLTFQAAYATQALLNVSDDENIWQAGFRRGWLVLKGAAGFAKMPDPTEIKDVLEGFENLYEVGKGGVRLLKSAMESIKNGESPIFTVKDGLKFKEAWYCVLRMAERDIQTGQLVKFKKLITSSSCRHQFLFQWGICLLLGRFAVDTQWEPNPRREALTFLSALCKDNTLWDRQKDVDQLIFDMLTSTKFNIDIPSEDVKSLLKELQRQNSAPRSALTSNKSLESQDWKFILPTHPVPHIASKFTLLATVQDEMLRHAKVMNLPDPPVRPRLDGIHSAIIAYHAPDLFIQRVSGEELDLEACFVNLAIVEAPAQREQEKKDLKEQEAVFHRIQSFEMVRNTDTKSLIPLEQLFDKRKLRDGKEGIPKRILVQGRAGIGKTTLCKKLVYGHQNGLWRNRFDIILWIPLRRLRGTKSHSLEELFREKVVVAQDSDQEQALLSRELMEYAKEGKVLFILDGLDEIVTYEGDDSTFRSLLAKLLSQQNVVITSRPSGLDRKLLPSLDLELETVGFSPQNVNEFVVKVFEKVPEAAGAVQNFIRRTPLVQGLVNIPVQLDVMCFSWDSLPKDGLVITMTRLYQLMIRKLWHKDAFRLKKTAGGMPLTERQIDRYLEEDIDDLMTTELQHLGYLAFKGMDNNHQILFDERQLFCAFRDLKDGVADDQQLSPSRLVDHMKDTSFLHTSDSGPDSNNRGSQQTWHFLHLTFQEYFAATWIVRHLQPKKTHSTIGMMTMDQMKAFVHRYKYNPQYEIVWWMVAGLLEGEALEEFFRLFQAAPRDFIGGRHQQLLASCLNEARARLDTTVVTTLDAELTKWLHFEIQTCDGKDDKSMLASQSSFPETLLVKSLDLRSSSKAVLVNTLGSRSMLSEAAIWSLIGSLKDESASVRSSAAEALGKQSTLSEVTIQSPIGALKDEIADVRSSAAWALGKQSTLSEAVIQCLIGALRDEDTDVRSRAAEALGKKSTLSEAGIQSLIGTLKDEDADVRRRAAKALGKQSTLSEAAIWSLIGTLKDESVSVRFEAERALREQSTLSEAVIQCLIGALRDEDIDVRRRAAV